MDNNNNNKGEILVVPYPIQGHVIPMMKLSEFIANNHGIKVTLVLTEHNYKGMVSRSMIDVREADNKLLRFVTVSDGLEPDDDRKDHVKVALSVFRVMPEHVKGIIGKGGGAGGERVSFRCLVADSVFGWAPKVAEELGVKLGIFWTSSPGALATTLMIPELVKCGFIDQQGNPLKKDLIHLLSNIPSMKPEELPWYNHHEETFSKNNMFKTFSTSEEVIKKAKWVLCNWFQDLIPSAKISLPSTIPIGPLVANTQQNETLYPEDSACLIWLNQQPSRSVIYVAFGSILSLNQRQLSELAHGLELSGRRFLWAVRADMSSSQTPLKLPEGFEERIANCGKLVEWASQEKVLAHPSIACFLTHCGWNSTMEGLSYGVPLLCWPCFADQFYTRTCICDAWKTGLSLVTEENKGVISANDVRSKIDELLSRNDLRENAGKFMETVKMAVGDGRGAFLNLQSFINEAKI